MDDTATDPIDDDVIDEAADAALLAELRVAADLYDPVPAHLVEFARLAPDLRRMDDEIAELLDNASLAGVRNQASDDVMSFAGPDTSIELDVSDGRIVGQLVPPVSATVALESPTGVIEAATSDARGHFSFGMARGSIRVVAETEAATTSTEWFVL